ncbi:type II toxin-antitoxin system RelE family toxin [Plantactinospora sp. WMMB334]|uniref:type II toxin-antitoxin system RelE family toxin n=1 Tax=Plantactinospora sp. WMMB334 TaxID=3404119 RepID=UPI003B927577
MAGPRRREGSDRPGGAGLAAQAAPQRVPHRPERDPRPGLRPGATELDRAARRIRASIARGDYRVLYRLDGDELTIHAVGHRKDVYS